MSLFTSNRERNLWLVVITTMIVIFSTLFIGNPLLTLFEDQNVQALFFVCGMFLVAISIGLHAILTRPTKIEVALIIGIAAIYLMLILRLGLPERSHMIEYSVLAIAIHKAFIERQKHFPNISPASMAILLASLIGVIDECIQLFIPNRVFDYYDIAFNGMVVLTAIFFHLLMGWLRKKIGKSTKDHNQ